MGWCEVFETCARRVLAVMDATRCSAEFVVVLDGSAKVVPDWLARPGVRVVSTGRNCGPAVARNLAASEAAGELLFFIDSDVELADGAIDLVHARFAADASLVGLFGAYDDEPAAEGTVSQFRNLLHHHTHVAHPGRADSFWSGCGAIRASHFRAAGGFDEKFRFPSVEDVELGVRITSGGGRIELDPALRCKHHKNWTLGSMVHTDVVRRAVPWTRMMLRTRRLSLNLATNWNNRICGAASLLVAVAILPALYLPILWILVGACLAAVLFLNFGFYRTCVRKRGILFGAACFGLHVLFFAYSSATFGAVVLHARLLGGSPDASESPARGTPGIAATLDRGEPLQATLRD